MRKWLVPLGVLGLAATAATAQTIPASISTSLFQVAEDDGVAETSFKIYYPSRTNDLYNVDFNTDATGMTVLGVAVELYVSSGGAQLSTVAVCGDNLALDASGRTPDFGSPLAALTNPTGGPAVGAYCNTWTTYDTPNVTLGTGGVHAVVGFKNNDSQTWMCTDMWDANFVNHPTRHSYFTTDAYATPASYNVSKWNYMIRLAGSPQITNGGAYLVNGSTNSSMLGGNTVALQFWSADGVTPTLYLSYIINPFFLILPVPVQSTGFTNFVPNGIQALGVLSGTMPCAVVGLTLDFGCFFSDNLDKKKNGKNKIKSSNNASITVNGGKACTPNVCFGIRDDGTFDGGIFNPRIWYGYGAAASTNDTASVRHGAVSALGPPVTNLTAVETLTWDFCGTNPCWQEIGIYAANTGLDASGNTPNPPGSAITSVSGSSACYPGGAGGVWGFPGTVYTVPSVAANTSTNYHTMHEYANNDSCLFVGLDRTGTSDNGGLDCAGTITGTSSVNCYSFYSLDGDSTPAVDGTVGGIYPAFILQERINWT